MKIKKAHIHGSSLVAAYSTSSQNEAVLCTLRNIDIIMFLFAEKKQMLPLDVFRAGLMSWKSKWHFYVAGGVKLCFEQL